MTMGSLEIHTQKIHTQEINQEESDSVLNLSTTVSSVQRLASKE